MARGTFTGVYVKTAELGKMSGDRTVELGHYKDGDKEYADKIYIHGSYFKRDGSKAESITATKLTIKDLAELQKIDLSKYDTTTDMSEAFD